MKRILLVFLAFSCISGFSQDKARDVKVGLVLSGGGAKGLAHIGVLKVIEESGIRIDYIGGTSMGAIIGGLYASGYTAHQIDSIVQKVDFSNIIQDNLPREAKTFYEREDGERYALTLPFDKFQIKIPQSFSKGQNTYNLLSQTLDPVSDITKFSELPIPFLCIATDVENGAQILLEEGYLPEAISASGALPSLYRPILLNGKLLVDGGVANNYPIDEIKAKGMDMIIGVDVQDGLLDKEELKSAPDVLLQISNYRTIEMMNAKKELADVYIKPNIDEFNLVSFEEKTAIIQRGSEAAKMQLEALKDIAARQNTDNRPKSSWAGKSPHKMLQPADSLQIDKVVLSGNIHYTRSYVLGKLKLKTPSNISYPDFGNRLNNLSATENFERINHRIVKEGELNVLVINLVESTSRQSLRFGLHYDDLFRSAALINFSRKRLLFNNDIASFDFILGDNIRYDFNYYIDKGYYWSVGVRSRFAGFSKSASARVIEQASFVSFPEVNRVNLDYQTFSNQLYFRTVFIKDLSLDLGLEHTHLDIETQTIEDDDLEQPGFVFENNNFFGAFGQLKYDSLDKLHFPKKGVSFDGDINLYLDSSNTTNFSEFAIVNASFLFAQELTHKLVLLTSIDGGFKLGGSDIGSLNFFLGGYGNRKINNFVPLYGYDFLSITGDGYVKLGLELDYNFLNKNHILFGAQFANAGQSIFTSDRFLPPPEFTGYGIGYGLETILGPLELRYTYSPERRAGEVFFTAGFRF